MHCNTHHPRRRYQKAMQSLRHIRPGAVFSEQTDIGCPDQIVIGVNNLGTHIWNDPSVVNTKTQHIIGMHLCRQRKRARKQAAVVTNQVGFYQLT